jgi:membrane protein YdbS with pleckstrin-like domain
LLAVVVISLTLDVALWFFSGRYWRSWGYAERDRDLVLRRGILIRRLTIVPYGRMQFVDTTQGPLERLLGVSTVILNTAAAASDARIPMVKDAEAERLREQLTRLGVAYATGL